MTLPPRLMVPAEQLRAAIDKRVDLGEDLLNEPPTIVAGNNAQQRIHRDWTEYNRTLLRQSFDSAEIAEEYSRDAGDLSEEIQWLRSFQNRLHLYVTRPDTRSATDPTVG